MKFESGGENKKVKREQRQGKLVRDHPRQKEMKRNDGWWGKLINY